MCVHNKSAMQAQWGFPWLMRLIVRNRSLFSSFSISLLYPQTVCRVLSLSYSIATTYRQQFSMETILDLSNL